MSSMQSSPHLPRAVRTGMYMPMTRWAFLAYTTPMSALIYCQYFMPADEMADYLRDAGMAATP